ncbi:hypothetical protein BCR34DRAFT_318391 [Clohesyomyces aquaticus]|uniref:Uncharacterized protein n=1 Tax=Clohesyomyces aquaticus TaxID=1231657 RepID=A0A1Y1ZNP6_9PLEO|nr:hypothetical protein BCR34DRAFT_318391 [Clohesyomyces aquaticus]
MLIGIAVSTHLQRPDKGCYRKPEADCGSPNVCSRCRLEQRHALAGLSSSGRRARIRDTRRRALTMIDLPALLWGFRRGVGCRRRRGLVPLRWALGGRIGFIDITPLIRGLGRRHTRRSGSIGPWRGFRHQLRWCAGRFQRWDARVGRPHARRLYSGRIGASRLLGVGLRGGCASTFAGGTLGRATGAIAGDGTVGGRGLSGTRAVRLRAGQLANISAHGARELSHFVGRR